MFDFKHLFLKILEIIKYVKNCFAFSRNVLNDFNGNIFGVWSFSYFVWNFDTNCKWDLLKDKIQKEKVVETQLKYNSGSNWPYGWFQSPQNFNIL